MTQTTDAPSAGREPRKTLIRLTREGTSDVVAVVCSTCHRCYPVGDSFAERCCDPHCADCGVELPVKSSWTCCDSCRASRSAARDAELRAKAVRIPEAEYDGPVYLDSAWNEGYLRDTDELREWIDDQEEPIELTEVWACTSRRLQLPSADNLCERITDDSFDGAYDQLVGIEELQVAVDAFNAAQTAEEWNVDYSRLVVLAVAQVTP